jgi:hypothetical protein
MIVGALSCRGMAVRRTVSLPVAYVPGIPIQWAQCIPERDGQNKFSHVRACEAPLVFLLLFPRDDRCTEVAPMLRTGYGEAKPGWGISHKVLSRRPPAASYRQS